MLTTPPAVLIFDVNETLSDLTPLSSRFEAIGLDARDREAWFAGVLRDGFALTAAGGYADFADLAADGVRALAWARGITVSDDDIAHVLAGFGALDVHADVVPGMRALRAAGIRLATMTNGSVAVTAALLARAGVQGAVELMLDVRGPRAWKPAAAAYRHAVEAMGVAPAQAALVAVHPWDVDGAMRAGLQGIWVRRGVPLAAYPRSMRAPTLVVDDLLHLATALAAETGDPASGT